MVQPHYVLMLCRCPWSSLLPCTTCLRDIWQWICKLSTCFTGLDLPLSGLRVATDVLKCHIFDMVQPHYAVRLFLCTSWLLLPCSICLMDIWQWICKLSTCFTLLDPPLPGLRVAMDVLNYHNSDMVWLHSVAKLFLWTWWLLLPCSICLVDVWRWICKLSTDFTGLDRPFPSLNAAKDALKSHNFDMVWLHSVTKLFLWTWWLLLPCSICLVDVWQ